MPRVQLRTGEQLHWVEWPDDPRHVLVFENQHTRIYRARFDAGEDCETLFHRHAEDTVYACITHEGPNGVVLNTEVVLDDESQLPVGLLPPAPVSFTSGLCFCHLNKKRNRIHRIQTAASNTSTLDFVGVEVLKQPPLVREAPLEHATHRLEGAAHPRARVYRVTLPPGGSTGPVEYGFFGVVVVLQGAPQAAAFDGKDMAPGSAWFFEGPVTVDWSNAAGRDGPAAEVLVVEWC